MRVIWVSAALVSIMCQTGTANAIQVAPADSYLTPIGASNPSQGVQPYRVQTRDKDGNRIIINGRPVNASGSTLSPGGTLGGGGFAFGTMSSTSQGASLSQSTLSAISIGNNVSINNVRNSTIVINQRNDGEVRSTINTAPVQPHGSGEGNK